MKRKITIAGAILLVLAVLAVWAVPVFAADPSGGTRPSAQGDQQPGKVRIMARMLLIQDEAKVDALIAKALEAGRITDEQAARIENIWTNNHEKFTRKTMAARILRANDGARVQEFLDKGLAAGKITEAQYDRILAQWEKLHSN
jgi:type IV pilus biogenesis protein CpaD/CtpE